MKKLFTRLCAGLLAAAILAAPAMMLSASAADVQTIAPFCIHSDKEISDPK